MKKVFMSLGLAVLAATTVQAGEHTHDHSLEYSIFSDFRFLKPVDGNAMMAAQTAVAQNFPGWSANIDKLSSNVRDMYGTAMQVQGGTNADKAYTLMTGKLTKFGIQNGQWVMTRNKSYDNAAFVDFTQKIDGREVVFSKMTFRFTLNGALTRIKVRTYGQPEAGMTPSITTADVLAGKTITADMSAVNITSKKVDDNWVWFPVPTPTGYVLRPAYRFDVIGTFADDEFPVIVEGYVDARSGELLYRMNHVQETFEVTVQSEVYKTSRTSPMTMELQPDMNVTIGGQTYVTDANGTVNLPSLNAPQTATFQLRGPWSRVYNGGSTPSATATFNNATNTYTFQATGGVNVSDLNAFYHVNIVHDFVNAKLPGFTGMDNQLRTNVDLTSGSCNAFYNGNSINFYAANGNCRSFAEVGDIVYHEYGHGINRMYYSDNGAGFMRNGSLNEGYADLWALGINGDGIVGEGSYVSGGNIRDYTGTPKVYPMDLRGEVHADGEIIAGAWWDVAVNLNGNVDSMIKLFAAGFTDLPDGPLGTEGEIYHDILISALLDDDDDAVLSNGTPHFTEIASAFARHGILLMSDAELTHTELAHQPAGQAITVNASLVLSNPVWFQELKLMYRVRGNQWDTLAMTNTSALNFTAQIPAQQAGTIVDYYFGIYDFLNTSVSGLPNGYTADPTMAVQTTIPFQFGVGISERLVQDFESTATDWSTSISTDNATSGLWTQVKPTATFTSATFGSLPVQTGKDHTTGSGQCMVTGNSFSVSAQDVDGGRTTLQTPVIELGNFFDPVIEYYRWYSNDRAASSPSNIRSDYWQVQIGNTQSVIWKNVDYTYQSDHSWRRRIFKVSEYWTNASKIQMRFIASDVLNSSLPNSGENLVEAAVDDFIIYDGAPLSVGGTPQNIRAKVYPNPADQQISVDMPKGMVGDMQLMDVTGRVVSRQKVDGNTTNYTINTANIAAGTYMVFIQTDKAVQSIKVVVDHK